MKYTILENESEETIKLSEMLEKAHTNLLKSGFDFENKMFYLYDAPELKKLSPNAIITKDLILIDRDFFNSVNNNVHRTEVDKNVLNLLSELATGNFPYGLNLPEEQLLKTLNDNGYKLSATNIHSLLSAEPESFNLLKRDKQYVKNFINKNFPEAVHEFNKTKNIDKLLEFLAKEEKTINSLGNVDYGLIIHQFSNYSMKSKFGVIFENQDRLTIAKVIGKDLDSMRRKIFINELSDVNNVNIGLYEESVKKPKRSTVQTVNTPLVDLSNLSEKDLAFVKKFTETTFPALINDFKKIKDLNKIIEVLNQSQKEIIDLSDEAYKIIIKQFSNKEMQSRFDFNFTTIEKMGIAKAIFNKEKSTDTQRKILVDEISGFSELGLGKSEETNKPKMK